MEVAAVVGREAIRPGRMRLATPLGERGFCSPMTLQQHRDPPTYGVIHQLEALGLELLGIRCLPTSVRPDITNKEPTTQWSPCDHRFP